MDEGGGVGELGSDCGVNFELADGHLRPGLVPDTRGVLLPDFRGDLRVVVQVGDFALILFREKNQQIDEQQGRFEFFEGQKFLELLRKQEDADLDSRGSHELEVRRDFENDARDADVLATSCLQDLLVGKRSLKVERGEGRVNEIRHQDREEERGVERGFFG